MSFAALFNRDGDWFHPTPLTTGPWRADAMHGGPPSALIGLAIHDALEPGEQVARVGVDLEKPVPLEPMQPRCVRRQVSRRVAHLTVELRTQAGTVVASARALALRGQGPVPTLDLGTPVAPALPDAETVRADDIWAAQSWVFHRDAIEARFTRGGWSVPGSGDAWMRLNVPLVEGEPTPGLSQLLAVADFGSPLSQAVAPESGMALINVDVNVTLAGDPAGPWFSLVTQSGMSPQGIGLASTELFDSNGYLGVITQSQIVYAAPRA